jgi:hypothetical protein
MALMIPDLCASLVKIWAVLWSLVALGCARLLLYAILVHDKIQFYGRTRRLPIMNGLGVASALHKPTAKSTS